MLPSNRDSQSTPLTKRHASLLPLLQLFELSQGLQFRLCHVSVHLVQESLPFDCETSVSLV